MKLTIEQMGQLLHLSRTASRRRQKRFLRELGGTGDSPELDSVLARLSRHTQKARIEAAAEKASEQTEPFQRLAVFPETHALLKSIHEAVNADRPRGEPVSMARIVHLALEE